MFPDFRATPRAGTRSEPMLDERPWNDMLDEKLSEVAINNTVKLVIWDLDDTFWKGTLSEGGVVPIASNVDLVKELARRGIVSSICSKNEIVAVSDELKQMNVWDYFVSPKISFQSKGSSIVRIVEALHLRPDNVVFIDDNPSVLAEAAFNCPGLVCLDSPARLSAQMDSPHLRGSVDMELKRLAQYQLLVAKNDNKEVSGVGEINFLRQSDIRIEIDYSVEPHMDRIIELVNRSNQLNYTKIRIETDQAKENFLKSIRAFGYNAGVIRVWDKYGDYGVVGFFMTLATLRGYRLEHFVFSCRIMNMGIEQYVYNYLKNPEINIVQPVACPIEVYPVVDWIEFGSNNNAVAGLRQFKFVLIGGCDMLQLSTYCSADSVEFTNRDEGGLMKRLDDPFFILDDPEQVKRSPLRSQIPAFNADEMLELRGAVQEADAIVLSIYRMMEFNYFRGSDGLMVRLDQDTVTDILKSDRALWFVRNFNFVEYSHEQRNELIHLCLSTLSSNVKDGCKIIVLLENVRKLENNDNERFLRNLYNDFIKKECSGLSNLTYIDVNEVTDVEWLFDDGFHMSRQGYYELAQAVKGVVDN
jgi:FkbH-like protein